MTKTLTLILGIVFIIVGVLGFIGNPIVGDNAYFQTNTAHDIVHLIVGIIMVLVAVASPAKSAATLKIFGVIYLLLAIVGFIKLGASGQVGNLLGLDLSSSDNWLHLVLGIVLIALGLGGRSSAPAPMVPPSNPTMNM